ncbi:hypothetical protein DFR86_10950 [Acidianus sulfidivorans JP7]|uniref:Amidohydrolase-related domain-containing protein n=1 Tax=Acidianus sulfidivorans JP7 TaxID=619593 RepID=A0A2U9IPR6_9CREN|nr:hypothetical protein [Acidianus sulfidivorans]AWR98002.1 hypothetical protein DFR86_10950 [Acidianus sulfidivorans JP7]
MLKVIDGLTYYGIKFYSYVKTIERQINDIEIEKIVLSPLYKYSCKCCVDGFYQQYLWSLDKDYVIRLGIYNPNCRVPPNIEIPRQYDKGIHGIVLNPVHHEFSLDHPNLAYVYEFAEDHDLPIIVYLPSNIEILNNYKIKVGLVNWDKNNSVELKNDNNKNRYCFFSSSGIGESNIYASQSPYFETSPIDSIKKIKTYDQKFVYYNAKDFFKI